MIYAKQMYINNGLNIGPLSVVHKYEIERTEYYTTALTFILKAI